MQWSLRDDDLLKALRVINISFLQVFFQEGSLRIHHYHAYYRSRLFLLDSSDL